MSQNNTNQYRQALVRYNGAEEAERLYDWLTAHGFRNVGNLTAENYTFPIVCVNESGEFFGTNVACMAAAASCGRHHTLSVEEFICGGFKNC